MGYPRSPIQALAAWSAKYNGAAVRSILDVSVPNMIAQEGVKFTMLDSLKNKVKAAVNALGLTSAQLVPSLAVCREGWRLQNTFSGATLTTELQNRRNTVWLTKYPLLAADLVNLYGAVFGIIIV